MTKASWSEAVEKMPVSVSPEKDIAGMAAVPFGPRRGRVDCTAVAPFTVSLLRPAVAKPSWSAAAQYIPVSESPEKERAGSAAVPF